MGISWLWHFTNANDADKLRVRNEERASAAYTRWRALNRMAASLACRLRDISRNRKSARELESLTDDVLRDVGLWRGVDGRVVEAPREWNRRGVAEVLASPSTFVRQQEDSRAEALEIEEECDSRPCSPLPSLRDRPKVPPLQDDCGCRAA